MMRAFLLPIACALAALCIAAPARAELPPEVEAMIREAARIGNGSTVAAIVEVARSIHPDHAEEIEALGEALMPEETPPEEPPPPPAIAPDVEAMIRVAAGTGDAARLAAVVDVARAANPDQAAAIGALGMALAAQAPRPPIAPAVEAMIREAGRVGDATTLAAVVNVAKSNNPDETRAIDALGVTLMADVQRRAREAATRAREAEEARLAALGVFDGWSGQGEVGAGVTTGNTEQLSVLLGVRLNKEGLAARHKLAILADYQRTDGITSRERYSANHALNYLLGEGLYIATLVGWEQDRFAGFVRRFTESIGVGYRAISRPNMTLDIEGGPALRQTLYVDGLSDDEFGARGSLAFRWTLREGTVLSQDASLVGGGGTATLISTSSLTARFNRVLSGRVSFNLQSELEPQPGRRPTDTATRASLVYSF